jgi:hypothetical protein
MENILINDYWLDVEAIAEAYLVKIRTAELKDGWIEGLNRLFIKGHISLNTYLSLRLGKGKINKVSSIIGLVIKRTMCSLNILVYHNRVFLLNRLKGRLISQVTNIILGMVGNEN